MFKRAAVVVIGLPIVLVLLNNNVTFKVLVVAANAVALWEFQFNVTWPIVDALTALEGQRKALRKEKKITEQKQAVHLPDALLRIYCARVTWALSATMCCTVACVGSETALNGGCVLFSALLVLVHLAKVSMTRVESLLPSACALLFDLFGLFHLSWCLSHAIVLASKDEAHGRALCSFGLLCAWNGDSAALLCGKVLGRIKPFPKISKGKTVAGMGGALLGSMITAIGLGMASRTFFDAGKNTPSSGLISAWMAPLFALPKRPEWTSVWNLAAKGLVIGFLGMIGDLLESIMKRAAHIKDSSSLIPGHGGLLDRLDSIVFVAPFVCYAHELGF